MVDTLWIDVEDLFDYAAHHTRLSGIQRVAFEVCQALWDEHGGGGHIRFVRYDPPRNSFRSVRWSAVAALLEQLTREPPSSSLASSSVAPSAVARPAPVPMPAAIAHVAAPVSFQPETRVEQSRGWLLLRRLVWRLPTGVRQRLVIAARLQLAAARANLELISFIFRGIGYRTRAHFRRPAAPPGIRDAGTAAVIAPPEQNAEQEKIGPDTEPSAPETPVKETPAESGRDSFAAAVRPGDILVNFSASWTHPDYAGLIRNVKKLHGVRFALLIHDIIPLRHPEWFDRGLVRTFRHWADTVLPLTDHVLATSHATAGDVGRYLDENGISVPHPIRVVPLGTGFKTTHAARPGVGEGMVSGEYVLFVSTIEARKNHLLLFRVWRRLLAEMPAGSVPSLIFAGRVGWLVDDLMRQLENCDYLDGKISVLRKVTDAELAGLYHGCLFTVFPSLYEGWGLPVSESLAFGKPCVASNSTSIPEAGGALTRYFDPHNVSDAYAVIRATIEDREELRAWRDEVARSFVPTPWRVTARAVLEAVNTGDGS